MAQSSTTQDVFMDPNELFLDLKNPRMPDEDFDQEDDAIVYLADHADVDELVKSISSSGWLDYEPLIVLKKDKVVLEGNRRMAALRIMASTRLQSLTGVKPPPTNAVTLPAMVRVRLVDTKNEARSFIGFKHINGAFKWDSLAKARFAADWLDDGGDIDAISEEIGDNHKTILRLVNGWRVLAQAEREGLFDRNKSDKRLFPFSHLYTGLTRPGMRDYLGLGKSDELLSKEPVANERHDELRNVTTWLYGQPGKPAVIKSQNPDLKHLVEVLQNPNALRTLERTSNLSLAFDEAEDKSAKFSEVIADIVDSLNGALVLANQGYDGDKHARLSVSQAYKTARNLLLVVRAYDEKQAADSVEDDDIS